MNRPNWTTLICALVFCSGVPLTATALTADNVNCNKCVGNSDLGKKAVSGDKIKKKTVTNAKISKDTIKSNRIKDKTIQTEDLSDALIGQIGAGDALYVVDSQGMVVGPLSSVPVGVLSGALVDGNAGLTYVGIAKNSFFPLGPSVSYSLADCKGTPYMGVTIPFPLLINLGTPALDPVTGKLAALTPKNPLDTPVATAILSSISPVLGVDGTVTYPCVNGAGNPNVVEAQVAADLSIFTGPFSVQQGP